ncbi:hypothetical protein EVAR_96602_1 [Eumeta japonica]|uniref:Uncharacterized protein n=1 Tax=Eumeta variegata TaxID=151549 RepID=A0A4C1WV47_EUMVA|nr:hypothetical protein EVAR_96602_1 [Eumeta japonica]
MRGPLFVPRRKEGQHSGQSVGKTYLPSLYYSNGVTWLRGGTSKQILAQAIWTGKVLYCTPHAAQAGPGYRFEPIRENTVDNYFLLFSTYFVEGQGYLQLDYDQCCSADDYDMTFLTILILLGPTAYVFVRFRSNSSRSVRTVVPYTYTLSERSAELHGRRSERSRTTLRPTRRQHKHGQARPVEYHTLTECGRKEAASSVASRPVPKSSEHTLNRIIALND